MEWHSNLIAVIFLFIEDSLACDMIETAQLAAMQAAYIRW